MSYEIPSPADVRNELEKRRKEREKSPLVKVALHITNTYLTEMAIELAVKKMMSRAENVLVNPLLSEAVAELLDEPKYFSAEQIEKIREEIRADAKVDNPREVLQQLKSCCALTCAHGLPLSANCKKRLKKLVMPQRARLT